MDNFVRLALLVGGVAFVFWICSLGAKAGRPKGCRRCGKPLPGNGVCADCGHDATRRAA